MAGMAKGVILKADLTGVLLGTTVMEKSIAFPTDSKLYSKCLLRLSRVSRQSGIGLPESYTRTAKRMASQIGHYAHARHFRRMHRDLNEPKGPSRRVVGDLARKTTSWEAVPGDPGTGSGTLAAQAETDRCQQAGEPARAGGGVHQQRQGA